VPLNGVCLQIVASAPLGIADCNDCSLKRPRGEIMWNHSTSASAEHVQKPCIANMTKISESFWVNPIHGTHLRLAEPVSCSTFPDGARGPGLRSQLLHWLQLWSFAVLNPWQSFWSECLKKSSANAEFFKTLATSSKWHWWWGSQSCRSKWSQHGDEPNCAGMMQHVRHYE
jgi:hypothetical protein